MSLANELTIVIVTSPSPTNPSTILVSAVLDSLAQHLPPSVEACRILVVCDGYNVVGPLSDTADDPTTATTTTAISQQLKRGRVNETSARNYEDYKASLDCLARNSQHLEIIKLDEHVGFAFAVRHALSSHCSTSLALICQHDRVFLSSVPEESFGKCLNAMRDEEAAIRYIGFPTINNAQHDLVMATAGLSFASAALTIPLSSSSSSSSSSSTSDVDFCLHPLFYFYDSNHLAHVERYLQLYQPFKRFPPALRDRFDAKFISQFILRRGDFTEDRLGQQQRRCILELRGEGSESDRESVLAAMRFFGTYLLWQPRPQLMSVADGGGGERRKPRAQTFVGHLRGRQRQAEDVAKIYTFAPDEDEEADGGEEEKE